MASTSFEPGWNWPENLPGSFTADTPRSAEPAEQVKDEASSASSQEYTRSATSEKPSASHTSPGGDTAGPDSSQRRRTHYGPRTCRICLETVLPKYEMPAENLPDFLQGRPNVEYVSEDGGRLIRPCLCKGSQKYVHEGCLSLWRLQDPNNKRNYWECPTCKYNYRLGRMTWAHWIGSTAAQVMLTILIFIFATFFLGYVADPIINLYVDPWTTVTSGFDDRDYYYEEDPSTWFEHFIKGFASLGLLGFMKFLFTAPWQWLNMRGTTVYGGGRAGTTGRDRMQQISWFAVIVGIITVLWAVWKGVRAWSRRTLTRASERVMDVPVSGDDDDDDE
ncbi:hypothetical protein BDZ85DRAFT_272804 [Elsinoe ampelina]|uniref:RING-CH-type domain-containing protein n=1 Tax=Elsinoe ampelina TaxID=302913 RepID=A0A6A6GGD4_9PEZI|nr:hypothetical protein BDZ85DRAFT_272804 [Elsinoe ampelina]